MSAGNLSGLRTKRGHGTRTVQINARRTRHRGIYLIQNCRRPPLLLHSITSRRRLHNNTTGKEHIYTKHTNNCHDIFIPFQKKGGNNKNDRGTIKQPISVFRISTSIGVWLPTRKEQRKPCMSFVGTRGKSSGSTLPLSHLRNSSAFGEFVGAAAAAVGESADFPAQLQSNSICNAFGKLKRGKTLSSIAILQRLFSSSRQRAIS